MSPEIHWESSWRRWISSAPKDGGFSGLVPCLKNQNLSYGFRFPLCPTQAKTKLCLLVDDFGRQHLITSPAHTGGESSPHNELQPTPGKEERYWAQMPRLEIEKSVRMEISPDRPQNREQNENTGWFFVVANPILGFVVAEK